MKKVIIALASIILIFAALLQFFPSLFYPSSFGQKIILRFEGDKAAHFYFNKDQSSKDSLFMEGVIYSGTLNDFKKVIENNPQITTLVMVEVPGSVDDVINLAASKEIRNHHINTYIPENGWVASGGTDMFLAGEKRSVHPTAKLGVHSWEGGELAALEYPRDHEEHQKYLEYYREMEIPLDFYWYTLEAAPANEMHWMTASEIETYRVITVDLDFSEMLKIQEELSSDKFMGRASGNNLLAQNLITDFYKKIKLNTFDSSFKKQFKFKSYRTKKEIIGTNLIGYLKGKKFPERYIVIGAHYDHLGVRNDTIIYNGADDNASGTAALMVLAEYFSKNTPNHSIIFAAWDAEEMGLHGSKAFINSPPVDLSTILLNINFDMLSFNPTKELYVVGTHYYPEFKPLIEKSSAGAQLKVSYGHDNPDDKTKEFWMFSSDNGSFHRKGIPNITFSEEDHIHYHKPTDDFENINQGFYKEVVGLILKSVAKIDQNFPVMETSLKNK